MNKRKLNHYWGYIKEIKIWHLSLIFIILVACSTWALKNNSERVIPLVNAVLAADKTGEGVDETLRELGNYMTNHMNSQIGSPIRLENTYYRDFNSAVSKSQATADGGIYKQAQEICEDPSVLLSVRAQCIQDYVLKHSKPGQEPEIPNLPNPDAYTYTFNTPLWSPDLAGILIVASFYSGIFLVSRLIAGELVRRVLKNS